MSDQTVAKVEAHEGRQEGPPPLVGRGRELRELLSALRGAREGHGAVLLLAGDPGLGKTALAESLAGQARDQGALVLWGSCWEGGGAPPFWPWTQVARACAAERGLEPEPTATALLGDPEASGQAAAPGTESQDERFILFNKFAAFLQEASRERPLLVVVDDLHAADEPSLRLLEFLARELRRSASLVVATYRPAEADVSGVAARTISLGGLDDDEVARFVETRSGVLPGPKLVTALRERTEGNPLFLDEVLRVLDTEQLLEPERELAASELPLPQGVRDAIRRRLQPLPGEAHGLIRLAAVLGVEFALPALDRASGLPAPRLVELIDQADQTGLVTPAPGPLGRWRFTHALIRDVVLDDLTSVQRMELHEKAGLALEEIYALDVEPHLAELAHHFLQAAAAGQVDRAVDYAGRAGDRAVALLAAEEAIEHYEGALQALDLRERPDPAKRLELLLALGTALRISGARDRARETFRSAAALAADVGDAELQARAALGFAGRYWTAGVVDDSRVTLLEAALAALGDGSESPLRAAVLGRLATELYYADDRSRADELSARAVELARRVGGPADVALVLDHRLGAVWSPDNLEERLDLAAELVAQAEQAGDRVTELRGRAFLVSSLLESGHAARADRELQIASRLAEDLRQPVFLWHTLGLRVVRAAMEGRFDEVDVLAEEALAAGRMADAGAAEHYYVVQTAILERRSREELLEFEAPVRGFTERFPALPWRGILALLYAELGRESDARREFERVAAEDWADVQHDSNWLLAMVTSAKVCSMLGDTDRARTLYELLLPYSGRYVVLGRVAAYSVGAAARYIGLLAMTLEDWDAADQQFEAALKLDQAMGARMWAAETRYDYGRMLLARGAPGDAERAAELMGEALREAETLGLKRMLERDAESAPAPISVAAPAGRMAVFRRRGDYWEIGYEGSAHMVKDLKGLGYVAALLGNPGTEIHVGDLAGDLEPAPELGDAGAVLDSGAKEAYRLRVEELRQELAQAEEWGDPERVSRAREEIEFLGQELAGAVGLGGRDRKAASVSERARVNVTRAIRSAVQRVAENDPELARHLDTAIRTGTFCSYEPDPHAGLSWSLGER